MEPAEIGYWFEQMAPGLVLYARQIAGAAAEDVVQEVFLRLAGQAHAPEQVKGWLLLTVRRAALDAAKRTRRQATRERRAGTERRTRAMLEAKVPGAGVPAEEVTQAMAGLALEEREIVTLRIWNGATLEEIAGILGMPVSTVHHKYRTALKTLRSRWEVPCQKE